MENNLINLKGASKAITALIDAVSRGIGTLYEPTNIRRLAKAKADETVILAKAECEKKQMMAALEAKLVDSIPSEKLEPIVSRIVGKEIKRQENIDAVVQTALDDLNDAKSISDKKAETDWLTRFFDIVEDISDDELRVAWGKILSQEIQSPGSYSLRTLSTISNLSRKEADLFTQIGNLIFCTQDCKFLLKDNDAILGSSMGYNEISLLMECGLLKEAHELNIIYSPDKDNPKTHAFVYQDMAIFMEIAPGTHDVHVPIYELTTAGNEIYNILNVKKDMSLFDKIAKVLKRDNVRVGYAKMNFMRDGIIEADDEITYL